MHARTFILSGRGEGNVKAIGFFYLMREERGEPLKKLRRCARLFVSLRAPADVAGIFGGFEARKERW
jgi:hypothetical protein